MVGCRAAPALDHPDAALHHEEMLRDLSRLSHDSLEGRQTGTPGNEKARRYIVDAYRRADLRHFGSSFEQPFSIASDANAVNGVNVIAYVPGSRHPDSYIVVSAHYDHLGIRNGMTYNGADDNASGVAALLGIARRVAAEPLTHTVIFLAADAEELGLLGARAFVNDPPVVADRILANVNMDMVSHSDSVLYVAGTYHYPEFIEPLQAVAERSKVVLRFGHDRPDLPAGDDWTNASDHGSFHEAGIPFVYFGVEDHPDYHQPSDDPENINPTFYADAVETIWDALKQIDQALAGR